MRNTLLLQQSQNRQNALQQSSEIVLPSLILLFEGLKRAYAGKERITRLIFLKIYHIDLSSDQEG